MSDPSASSEQPNDSSDADSPVENGQPMAESAEPDFDPTFDTETVTQPRDEQLYQRSLANALIAARCADEMRARDIVVLDMTKIASIVDFFVIGTGTSRRQMHAIADEVNRKLKGEEGNTRLNIEGYRTEGNWILMDFGDVVLHVFTEEGRQLYDLENLKADAERVDWQNL
ncbi:ribosome silencing factor [Fuerstiella marisgermanici]|uniref:Ribosomal silencing factor RsfS n=1 Tax=Fuerstiella marisgermanici TaxID=1891926 RepID=A0A1P8WEH2_9PLAN|nr:ribosome silencing factor [Fuerstiella marisgermanici]APZ92442.1 Ribosomal silencing factor RsfS [Fuerstiella marisgermanici]